MARKSASVGPGLSDDGGVWDEDFAPEAFAEFDFPRRRITGGKGRAASGNGHGTSGNGHSANGNGRSANGNGHSANGNGRIAAAESDDWFAALTKQSAPRAAREATSSASEPASSTRPGQGVPGRRTVTIRGHGAERNLPWTAGQSRHRPAQPRYQRPGFRADRAAMWAVLLGIMLVVVAAASSHAAMLRASAVRSSGLAHTHAVTRSVAAPRRTRGF